MEIVTYRDATHLKIKYFIQYKPSVGSLNAVAVSRPELDIVRCGLGPETCAPSRRISIDSSRLEDFVRKLRENLIKNASPLSLRVLSLSLSLFSPLSLFYYLFFSLSYISSQIYLYHLRLLKVLWVFPPPLSGLPFPPAFLLSSSSTSFRYFFRRASICGSFFRSRSGNAFSRRIFAMLTELSKPETKLHFHVLHCTYVVTSSLHECVVIPT